MSTPFSDSSRRRWPLLLALVLFLVTIAGLVIALLDMRTIEGAVPGEQLILGLSAGESHYLVGTGEGIFITSNGKKWDRVDGIEGPALLGGLEGGTVAVHGGRIFYDALGDAPLSVRAPENITAVAAGPDVFVATGSGVFYRLSGDSLSRIESTGGPDEVLALAVQGKNLLAGGLGSGLYRSSDGGVNWEKILDTPVRAALLDRGGSGRAFIATAGGVLSSADGKAWEFTDLRLPVEALAQVESGYVAVTADRLLYRSEDGFKWKPLAGSP